MATTQYRRKTKYASSKAVAEALKHWSDFVPQCRSWSHAWEPYSAVESPGVMCEIQQCRRCTGLRWRLLGAGTGKVLRKWQYSMPLGYALVGEGVIVGAVRDQIRLAAMGTLRSKKVANEKDLRAELRMVLRGD